jgi:hypothetical protein
MERVNATAETKHDPTVDVPIFDADNHLPRFRAALVRRNRGHTSPVKAACGRSPKVRSRLRPIGK